MTQPDQPEPVAQTPPREFSDWTVLRGAIAAIVSAYLLVVASTTLSSLEIVGQSHGGPTIKLTDLILMTALSSIALTYILGGIVMAVAAGFLSLRYGRATKPPSSQPRLLG